VKVDQHRSRTVLPRASVLEKTPGGWTVRPMTQTERWIWRIPMDLNSSSQDDFRRIPGIGPVLAKRIAQYVTERVWISNVDSLLQVKGVGPSKLESLTKYLEVEGSFH
jgi:DNA polymerase/3'-5' exonuclease PolX